MGGFLFASDHLPAALCQPVVNLYSIKSSDFFSQLNGGWNVLIANPAIQRGHVNAEVLSQAEASNVTTGWNCYAKCFLLLHMPCNPSVSVYASLQGLCYIS